MALSGFFEKKFAVENQKWKKIRISKFKIREKISKYLILRVKLLIFIIFKFITLKNFWSLFFILIYHEKNVLKKTKQKWQKKLFQKCIIFPKNSQKLYFFDNILILLSFLITLRKKICVRLLLIYLLPNKNFLDENHKWQN